MDKSLQMLTKIYKRSLISTSSYGILHRTAFAIAFLIEPIPVSGP